MESRKQKFPKKSEPPDDTKPESEDSPDQSETHFPRSEQSTSSSDFISRVTGTMGLTTTTLSEQEQIDNYTARYPIPGMPHEKRDMVLPLRPLSERPSRVRNLMSFMDLTATNAELDKLTVEELAKRPTPSKLTTARIEKNPRFFQSCMPTRPNEMKQRLECREMPETNDDPDRRSPPPIDAVPAKSCIRNEERKPAEERSVQFNYVKVTRYYIDNYDPIFKVARKWRRERGRDITFADSMAPSMRHLYLQVADYHTDLIYPTVIDRIDTSDRGMVASGFGKHYASRKHVCGSPRRCRIHHTCGTQHTSGFPPVSPGSSRSVDTPEQTNTSGYQLSASPQPERENTHKHLGCDLDQNKANDDDPKIRPDVEKDSLPIIIQCETENNGNGIHGAWDCLLYNGDRRDGQDESNYSGKNQTSESDIMNVPYVDDHKIAKEEGETCVDGQPVEIDDSVDDSTDSKDNNEIDDGNDDDYVDAPADADNGDDGNGDDNDDDDYTDAVAPQDDGCQDFDQQDNQDGCSVPETGRLSRRRRLVRSLRSTATRFGRLFTSCCAGRRS